MWWFLPAFADHAMTWDLHNNLSHNRFPAACRLN
jgi:hypothetical protein